MISNTLVVALALFVVVGTIGGFLALFAALWLAWSFLWDKMIDDVLGKRDKPDDWIH